VTENAPLRILIVDDAAEEREIYRRLLAKALAEARVVSEADTAGRAIEILRATALDCVLLDFALPDMNGLELLARVGRERPAVSFVLLSGIDDRELARRALGTGAQEFLFKGTVDPPSLARAIRHAIERQRAGERERTASLEMREELACRLAMIESLRREAAANARLATFAGRAMGIAADLDAPLASAVARLQAVLCSLGSAESAVREAADGALDDVTRCTALVRVLLAQRRLL
jgi:DNA-binding NtrC family response regulator